MIARTAGLTDGTARWPSLLAAFGAGVLAAAGQAPMGLWPLALVGFAALFAMVLPAAPPWRAARLMWLGGAGYFAAALAWIVQPFLVDAARDGWMAPFALVFMAFGLALFWGCAAWGAAWLGATPRIRALALVAALGLAELLRGYLFTGFPWASIGHLWIGTPVMQAAALGGPSLLTFLALIAALLPVAFGMRGMLVALALAGSAWGIGAWRLAQPVPPRADAPVVRLVQPNAAQHLKWRRDMIPVFVNRQIDLTAAPSRPEPDLIVWPETAVPYTLDSAGPVLAEIAQAADGRPVVLGIQRWPGARPFNSAVVLNEDGRVTQIYDKHHLVPFGEYMPLADLFARAGISGLAADEGRGYAAGPGARLLDLGPLGEVLPLICYEAIFPQDLRGTATRPDWILQITNDAWFGTFSGPYQHLAQARLRAVEQGLPLLRAANTGVSAVIGPKGRLLHALPLNRAGMLNAPLPAGLAVTPYARLGDLPMALLFGLALALLAARRMRYCIDHGRRAP